MSQHPMTSPPPASSGRARLQLGFSLIELMIAITLGLLILTGMTAVFVNTSATRNEVDRANRQIENGRYATELLRDDVQLAGFFGELDIAAVAAAYPILPTAMPDLCSATLLERTLPAFTPPNEGPGVLQLHVQGVNDFDASASTALDSCPAIKSAVKTGTDVILVRRAKTCVAGVGECDSLAYLAGKPVLQISFCTKPTVPSTSTIKTHALALYPNAGEFVHLNNGSPAGTACTVAAALRPYVIYLYFVGTYNGKENVLMRAEFTGTAMGNITPLVDGIESMQLDYGIDTNNDGNADSYAGDLGDPALAATVTKWSNVVSVQINLLARNTEASPDTITKTYNLGSSSAPVTFTDKFRRHVYSTQVRIQNISARREKP